jgi:hypothetical protein
MWERIMGSLEGLAVTPSGVAVPSGSDDARYEVTSVDEKGFDVLRASGKTLRVTRSRCEKVAARFEDGEHIAKRGVSYTVAVEACVLAALRLGGFEIRLAVPRAEVAAVIGGAKCYWLAKE